MINTTLHIAASAQLLERNLKLHGIELRGGVSYAYTDSDTGRNVYRAIVRRTHVDRLRFMTGLISYTVDDPASKYATAEFTEHR